MARLGQILILSALASILFGSVNPLAVETEISIAVPEGRIEDVRKNLFDRRDATIANLDSVYFDTADGALEAAGVAFRVRQMPESDPVQTIKASSDGGVFARREIEQQVPGGEPDPTPLAQVLPAKTARQVAQSGLRPRFRTSFQRTSCTVEDVDRDGAAYIVEIALDVGQINAGARSQRISEVEIELKSGTVSGMYEAAFDVIEAGGGALTARSKGDRAIDLLSVRAPPVVYAKSSDLDRNAGASESFASVAIECLSHWTSNYPNLMTAGEMEAVHQARVGIRRFRSALWIFKPIIETGGAAQELDQLRRFFTALGDVRNIDVFLDETLPRYVAGGADPRDVAKARRRLAARRAGRMQSIARELQTPDHTRFVLSVARWIESDKWAQTADPVMRLWRRRPLQEYAPRQLEKIEGKAMKAAKRARTGNIADWHAFRLLVKKLRYNAAFFSSLYPGDGARAYLSALKSLQDELGVYNDLEIGAGLLREPDPSRPAATSEAFDRLAAFGSGYIAGAEAERRAALERQWQALQKTEPFWRKD